jgi:apolipoprotein D and lipocalin family protein
MITLTRFASILACCLSLAACVGGPNGRASDAPPLRSVEAVDLARYTGTWYEIARFPTMFQRDCEGVTAQYSVRPDGRINVLNTCHSGSATGKPRTVSGIASVIEGSNGARIAVNFLPVPLPKGQGNYWVLYLDPEYKTALVGSPSGKLLWMLSRTSRISPQQRQTLNEAAIASGYRVDMLRETLQ